MKIDTDDETNDEVAKDATILELVLALRARDSKGYFVIGWDAASNRVQQYIDAHKSVPICSKGKLMSDEALATIRDALTWMDHFAKRHRDGTIENAANEALDALALLDAEDTPSVPMAMLWEVSSLVENATEQDRLAYCRSIAARYGYATKEET